MKKAVVLVCSEEDADNVCKLIAATLSLNGYHHDKPGVIDWPLVTVKPARHMPANLDIA